MNSNLVQQIKKRKLLIIIILMLIVVFFFSRATSQAPVIMPSPTPQPASWQNIIPGKTTLAETQQILGQPVEVKQFENTLLFKSESETRDHLVIHDNETVEFIKQINTADETNSKNIQTQYGKNYIVLYGPLHEIGYDLFVYPEKGIAYLGDNSSNEVLEIWYFEPTSLDDIITKWAPKYSKNIPVERNEGF